MIADKQHDGEMQKQHDHPPAPPLDNDNTGNAPSEETEDKKKQAPGPFRLYALVLFLSIIGFLPCAATILSVVAPTSHIWVELLNSNSVEFPLPATSSVFTSSAFPPGDQALGINGLSGKVYYRLCDNRFVNFTCVTQEECDARNQGDDVSDGGLRRRRRQKELMDECPTSCGADILWNRCTEATFSQHVNCPELESRIKTLCQAGGAFGILLILFSAGTFVLTCCCQHRKDDTPAEAETRRKRLWWYVLAGVIPVLFVCTLLPLAVVLLLASSDNFLETVECPTKDAAGTVTLESAGFTWKYGDQANTIFIVSIIIICDVSLLFLLAVFARIHTIVFVKKDDDLDEKRGS